MNKLYAWLSPMLAVLAVGCGDNGVRSPDFDSQLVDIIVSGPPQAAQGSQAQFRAIGRFTTPPSQQGALATSDISSVATWTVVQSQSNATCDQMTTGSNAATVNSSGLVTGVTPATVVIKATYKGKSGCAPFTVTQGPPNPDNLQSVDVECKAPQTGKTCTIAAGTTAQYCATGTYSRTGGPQPIHDTTVVWTSANPQIAKVPDAPNNTGDCIFVTGVAIGNTSIHASATESYGTFGDDGQIAVTSHIVTSVLRVEPKNGKVQVGSALQYTACGTFTDNSQDATGVCSAHPDPVDPTRTEIAGSAISNDQLDWTSATTDVATVATVNGQELATGVKPGTSLITATLKTAVTTPPGAQRSASATLLVIPIPPCTTALLASGGATVEVPAPPPLCLACTVDNKDFIIDAAPAEPASDAETFAQMNVDLAALDLLGQAHLDVVVHSPVVLSPLATAANPGPRVGFLIRRPTADLLAAEVLSQTNISTLLAGKVQESSLPANCIPNPPGTPPGTCSASDPLTVELLGNAVLTPGISSDTRALLYTGKVTKPFDAIRLSFSAQVASLLTTLKVDNACSVATPPTPPVTP